MTSPTVPANSANPANPAIYSPLDPQRKEIRLVTIHAGHTSDTIYCSLSTVSLSDKPLYEALSYTWGTTNSNVPIYVQGVPKQVTTTLESVLRYLRFIDRPRTIWIDALCINQSDVLERNYQVLQMGEVYTGAADVIAWLGEESEDSDLAFEAIDALPKSDQAHWDPGVAPSVSPETRSIRHLTALRRLLQRPWWQRVWTVQESILGKDMHFVCGSRKCSAESLFSLCQSF